jgi:hypothetical protein
MSMLLLVLKERLKHVFPLFILGLMTYNPLKTDTFKSLNAFLCHARLFTLGIKVLFGLSLSSYPGMKRLVVI